MKTPRSRHDFVKYLIGAALVVVSLLVYVRTFDHDFVNFDDPYYVTNNRQVQAGLTADGVRYAFTTFDCSNWHPLTWLSLELDAELYHAWNPGGFHITNFVFHMLNTLLLFAVFDRLTGMMWRSAAVAGLFALHPLHVESVAWISERKDVLSTFFWMLTLATYLLYVRRPSVLRYFAVVVFFALGLLSKPMLVTMPCVLLLLDYWPLRRWQGQGATAGVAECVAPLPAASARRLLGEKVPLCVLAAGSCIMTALANYRGHSLADFQTYSFGVRLGNAALAYVAYLGKAFWPAHLAAYYPHPGADVSVPAALAAGVLLAAVTVLVVGLGRRWPYLPVGWLWYLGTLVPVIGLLQAGGQAYADRYTYVPLIGIFLMAVWGVTDLALACRLPKLVPATVTAAALAACAYVAWLQCGYWQGDIVLWDHAIEVTERNAIAHCNRGVAYWDIGQPLLARREFEKAVEIEPRYVQAEQNLGTVLRRMGHLAEAQAALRKVIELDSTAAPAHSELAGVLHELGNYDEAEAEYRRAIELDPAYAVPHHGLGVLYQDRGQADAAEAEYRAALELQPRMPQVHHNLGTLLADQGRRTEALYEFTQVVRMQPYQAHAHHQLGSFLQEEGDLRDALAEFTAAMRLGDRSAEYRLRMCEQYVALSPRLPAVARGEAKPAGAREALGFATLCQLPFQGRYALAVRLFTEAFSGEPALADDRGLRARYHAACAAARASCGQGKDAADLDDPKKAELRGQALTWLQAELPAHAAMVTRGRPFEQSQARQILKQWLKEAAFSGLRGASLDKLSAAERAGWQKLWQEVTSAAAKP